MSGTPLRCGLCGEQIGVTNAKQTRVDEGGHITIAGVEVIPRCYACLVAEEAELITREASE